MKTSIFFLILFLAVSADAQVINEYGMKIGITSSKMNISTNTTYVGYSPGYKSRRFSGTFGIFLNMFRNKFFDLQNEISYHSEGAEDILIVATIENPDGIDELTWDHEYNFLKYNLNIRPYYQINNTDIYFFLGPSLNYLLKARDEMYLWEKLKSIYIGYNIGTGLTLRGLLNNPLILEIKYNGYFDKLADNRNMKVTMGSLQVNIGIAIE